MVFFNYCAWAVTAWERVGVKSLFGKSQPGRTSQRGLTYTLVLRGIWAQCIVVPGIGVFLRRGVFHPLGTNHQVSCSLISLAELALSAQARNISASIYSNITLISLRGEGAPGTLESAS